MDAGIFNQLIIAVSAMLLLVWLFIGYQTFWINGGLSGMLTRKKVRSLRQQGQLDGTFIFANAAELTDTGTVRKRSLENKMVNCVVPVEMLFHCEDHGLYYQYELGHVAKKDVAAWLEVAKALELAEISKILEEALLMHDIICHAEYDPEIKHGDQTLGDKLWLRASELNVKMEEMGGIAQLRAACETYLRRNAPEMLPLPTW